MNTKNDMTRTKKIRSISIFWSLFIGVGALWGGLLMLIDPSGKLLKMDIILPFFQKLPFADIFFQNFLFPAIALLVTNGLSNFISFILLLKNHRYAALSAMICGMILMLWIMVQFIVFPFNLLSTLYFIFGALQTWTGYSYHKRNF